MKKLYTLVLALVLAISVQAQSYVSNYDFRPANLDLCYLWFPNDLLYQCGAGTCGTCADAVDNNEVHMNGTGAYWAVDQMSICGYSMGGGSNVISVTGMDGGFADYVGFPFAFDFVPQIDTLQVVWSRSTMDPCDSLDIVVAGELKASIALNNFYPNFDTLTLTNLGCYFGQVDVQVWPHAGDQIYLKNVRMVSSPCLSTSVEEQEATITTNFDGVNFTTQWPTDVYVFDTMGRLIYQKNKFHGSGNIPLGDGVYIVRYGNTTKTIVR